MRREDLPPAVELLAPAGQPDAGYAALHYGADAVYLGLARFSARAEAVNFTPDELAEFAACAHSLVPRRGVYLTLNTLVKESELVDASETLLIAAECGVDAVIVQDLGVLRLVRERFPSLQIHASTQMAVHDAAGAMAARDLGCSRVTLARELTLDEVADIVDHAGVEVETFIHGTLCYSYSGLCLFSSLTTGRSGNRGRCVYSCREAADTPAGRAHLFSLKDMALGAKVRDLARVGVASLKIEGRKKSPLYVAATVDYYRRLLDGTITPAEAVAAEARLQTIFARPWTKLFIDGRRNPAAVDPEVVGHRGSPVGRVERLARTPAGPGLVFRTALAVERHDGIQVDLPGEARPLGFAVDNLYLIKGKKMASTFAAPAGATVAVTLPEDAPPLSPPLSPGLPVYLASSQEVKRSFPFFRPKAGEFGLRLPLRTVVTVAPDASGAEGAATIVCRAELSLPEGVRALAASLETAAAPVALELTETLPAFPARDAVGAETAAKSAFARTGGSPFLLADWRFDNPRNLYIRPGEWNRLRRRLVTELDILYQSRIGELRGSLRGSLAEPRETGAAAVDPAPAREWSLFVDDPACLARFAAEDFAACAELIVGPGETDGDEFVATLEKLAGVAGREKIRIAVPLLRRPGGQLGDAVLGKLSAQGWRRWLAGNLSAWESVRKLGAGMDIAADWPLYVLNHLAGEQLRSMGFSAVTVSPEDDSGNLEDLLTKLSLPAWIVVYADLPLFVSAACAHAHLGRCGEKGTDLPARCFRKGRALAITMEKSGSVQVWPQHCGSVVVGDKPYVLQERDYAALPETAGRRLRVDLRWRGYDPDTALAIWRAIRNEEKVSGHRGNFDRNLL